MVAQLRTLLILIVLAIVMIVLGRMVGGLTAPEGPISEAEVDRLIRNLDEPVGNRIDTLKHAALAGLFVSTTEQAHWPTVLEELAMARQYGVHTFVLHVALPWGDAPWESYARLQEALAVVQGAQIWLSLELTPTAAWLDAHPDEVSTYEFEGATYPSIGSAAWRSAGSAAIFDVGRTLKTASPSVSIDGIVLRALEDGNWSRSMGYDRSPANERAFGDWVRRKYETVEMLTETWGDDYTSFDEARVPDPPTDTTGTFFRESRHVDYMEYLNEMTANAVSFFADCAREAFGDSAKVYALYGECFGRPLPEHGQWAIGRTLAESVDGLALNLDRQFRSLGDTGGEAGPSTVPVLRGKRWVLLDDTRTGIGWNASTNSVFKPAGFEVRTVSPAYDRNLLNAAMEQGGVFWSDVRGQGNFLEPSLWDYFASRVPVIDELQNAASVASRTALIVLDERSMAYVADGERVGVNLINGTRRAIRQSGVSFGYVLLDDLLDGRAPEARVFIFPNLFRVEESVRERLHAYFAEHGAAAIWLYAPNAASSDTPAESVSAMTGITVDSYDESIAPLSQYALSGTWVKEEGKFGDTAAWNPLFYSIDEGADPLARYVATKDPSVVVKFMEEGWASVFVGVPGLSWELAREVFDVLDHPPVVRNSGVSRTESYAIRENYLLIHANDQGDRLLDFGDSYTVVDMLNDEVGWPDKQLLQLGMRAGETRMLKLTPTPQNPNSSVEDDEEPTEETPPGDAWSTNPGVDLPEYVLQEP